ncbi:DnaJ -like protein subfamily C member 9 [Echinococcus granulosus]|nr:DnaJ -like protein subfamily C member 9 [Echinococcus granulosus]
MGSFLDEVKQLFDTDNLYTLLGCDKSSTPAEIKRAFYKCSLKYHPDRNEGKDKSLATAQFQAISRAFSILSDKDAKDVYDETGIIGEAFSEKSFKDWVDYFNLIFPRFTEKDIEKQKKKYIGSEEEKNDIAKYYERYQGDMDKIMESVIFADVFDEDRYRGIIQDLIDDKTVKPYNAFVKESAKKRARRLNRAKREAAEFERQAKKQKTSGAKENSMDSLVLAIQANQEQRMKAANNLIDNLTAKYCQPPNKKARKSIRGKK